MANKKSKLKFVYDAPVTLTFVIVTILLYVLDLFVFKNKLTSEYLLTPTVAAGKLPFAFSDINSILRLLLHVFGNSDRVFMICNLIFILLLGQSMEERYGSVIIGVMIFVSALFSGVLNACFCMESVSGSDCIVFMLILLDTMMHLSRKKVSASSVSVIILFVCMQIFKENPNGIVGVVIVLAGGLCGSLFAFLTSPKARKAKKNESALAEFQDYNSPRFSNKSTGMRKEKKSYDDSEETVVGHIEL